MCVFVCAGNFSGHDLAEVCVCVNSLYGHIDLEDWDDLVIGSEWDQKRVHQKINYGHLILSVICLSPS